MLIDFRERRRVGGERGRKTSVRNICLYFFLKGRGGRKGEKDQCVVVSRRPSTAGLPATQACALTGNRTSDPLVCRLVLSPLSHTSQG